MICLRLVALINMRLPNDKMNLFIANKYPILNECVQQLLEDVNADINVYKKKLLQSK